MAYSEFLSLSSFFANRRILSQIMFSQSDDIDIALDTMMGKDFAEHVTQYLVARGLETHHVGVIQVRTNFSPL